MIYLYNLEQTNDNDIFIPRGIHYMPLDEQYGVKNDKGILKSKDELEKEGLLLDEKIDLSYEKDGEIFSLFINMATKEHFYRVTGKVEEPIKTQSDLQNEALTKSVATLNIENKKKDLLIENLAKQVSTLNVKLKGVLINEKQ